MVFAFSFGGGFFGGKGEEQGKKKVAGGRCACFGPSFPLGERAGVPLVFLASGGLVNHGGEEEEARKEEGLVGGSHGVDSLGGGKGRRGFRLSHSEGVGGEREEHGKKWIAYWCDAPVFLDPRHRRGRGGVSSSLLGSLLEERG